MFQFCSYEKPGKNYIDTIFKLVNDDFECEILIKSGHLEVGLIEEYRKRKLDAGKNLAIFTIWYMKKYEGWTVKTITQYQNRMCKGIEDWEKIKRSRNKWIKKLMIWV